MHYMVDLETLSTRIDAAIIQVGLAAFTEEEVVKSHLWVVEPEGHIDPRTIQWWFNQLDIGTPNPFNPHLNEELWPLKEAFKDMASRMKEVETVWAHRAFFDLPIIEMAHARLGLKLPWTHKQARDTVTFATFYSDVPRVEAEEKHDAEQDARAQAQWIVNIFKAHKQAK